ncbi:MAG: hypothetical protein UEP57_07695 [Oscillospiraceae bacterium]|nr:hypothetical protein [Oscillospiraceae bacterium]
MKRCFCLFLILCLLLSGCGILGERIKEPVTFYYLRSEYQYGTQDAVISSEEREASGHLEDLSYLLALYLMGPADEELKSPLPHGTNIFSAEQSASVITLRLSDTAKTMTDTEFSLACACLSLTCLDLTDAKSVTIISGDRIVTMSRDTLTLYDSSPAAEETK